MSNNGLEESIHFQQLEQKIIGALGVEPTMIADIKKVLSPNMFSVRKNQVIYKAILDVYSEGLSIDEVSVVEQLRKAENNQVTPHDVMQAFKYSSPMDAMNYSQVVAERWIKQQIREVSEKAASSAEREVDAFDLLHDTIKSLEGISNDGAVDKSYVGFSDLIEEALIRVNEEGTTSGVMTGLSGLDDLTNGFQKGDLTIIAGRPAMGKLQPLTEPILTPTGWDVMGNIKKGSEVVCPIKGTPVKVVKVHPRNNLKIYKVSFNDGSYTECCNEHLWRIQTQKDVTKGKSRVVDVDWMLERGILDTRNKSKYRIPLTNPIEFNEQDISLHPYLLGLFIADGYLPEKSQVTVTCHENDALDRFEVIKKIVPEGVSVKLDKSYGSTRARRIVFSSAIKPYLKELGLLGKKSRDKFVPHNYIYNSIAVRKELLSALLDTDGSCFLKKSKKSKQVSYSTMSTLLSKDVVEIVKSLGGKASLSSETREKYKGGRCFNISIKTPFNPFTLERKKEIFDSVPYYESFTKTIREISFLRRDKGQCITVDSSDHLYITRDYTVTHNSAFVTTIQKNAAKMGYKSLLFSLEMSKYQVACRLVSRDVDLPVRDLVQRRLSTHQKQQFNSEVRGLSSLPILVDDTARISIDQLRIKAREAKRKEGIDLLIVDYLQLMNGDGRSQSREQEISTISRGLKVIAKELDIPVVALSQLSRAVEQRENKRPLMSDLRESGSIEQDADAIFFLYRPEYYYILDGAECPPDLRGKAKVITGKFRNGESNDIILNFLGTYSSFEDEALDLSR